MAQPIPHSITGFHLVKDMILYILSWPTPEIVEFVAVLIGIVAAFNALIIQPIVFNYFIIPKIESKIGKKLEFRYYYNFFLFGNYLFRSAEIFTYMALTYVATKIRPNFKWKYKNSALAKVDYDINAASKFEIGMCFFSFINILICAISMIIILLINNVLKLTSY